MGPFQRYKTNMGSRRVSHGVAYTTDSQHPRSVHTPTPNLPLFPSRSIFYGHVKNDEFKTVLLIGSFFTHYFIWGASWHNTIVTFAQKNL